MVHIINGKKYDTEKMELISDKCEKTYISSLWNLPVKCNDVKLWKSKKGAYILTYLGSYCYYAELLSEEEAKNLLIRYDLTKYEELFGELEEG